MIRDLLFGALSRGDHDPLGFATAERVGQGPPETASLPSDPLISTDVRVIPLDGNQVALLEEIGFEFMRAKDPRSTAVLAIVLSWRVAGLAVESRVDDESNVIQLRDRSGKVER